MIKQITQDFSTGVSDELVATTNQEGFYLNKVKSAITADDYIDFKHSPSVGSRQFFQLLKKMHNKQLKVLDIGVGGGQSSVYIASLGHKVSCIEPSASFCNVINAAAKKFSLDIQIYRGVAEDMLNIEDRDFDIVFYNASFHHCDDPMKCLTNSYTLLKEGGHVFLASENFLKFWNSKKRWHYLLKNFPEKIGHYGGNEHIYYNWEYFNFIKDSKFKNVKCEPNAFTYAPVDHVEHVLITGVVRGQFAILIRYLFYMTTSFLLKPRAVFNLFGKISVVGCNFVGVK